MIQLTDANGLLIILLTIGILPFVAMVVSSYAKIVVVLGLLRNALGIQQIPPNMVLNGIAVLVSCYVMAPIGFTAMQNLQNQVRSPQTGIAVLQGFQAAREPFRQFLIKHSREQEKSFFLRSAAAVWPSEAARQLKPDDLIVLAPAFTLSELTDAFKIGFLLYLVFALIDIIIANVLMAMGLNQVNPVNISIPFKLLLFVVMDGWSTLIHGLVLTYR